MSPRIGLVHAVAVAVQPVQDAFAELWPEARTYNLLDDSLSADLSAIGSQDGTIRERILGLGLYVRDAGADAVLYTCSAFGEAIDLAKPKLGVPTLKPDEAMIDVALDTRGRIGLLATFAPTIAGSRQQFEERAAERGLPLDIELHHVPGAMDALKAGDTARHDALIAAAAGKLQGCGCIVLAQFSMARAKPQVEAVVDVPVLTSPAAAVSRLKQMLAG